MSDTTHLLLPLIAAAQAQKHVTHNEALLRLDALVQLSVIDRDLTDPPADPSDGDRYIVASGATGAWAGWDLSVAWFVDGAWTRLVPREGWRAWVADEAEIVVFLEDMWQLLTVTFTSPVRVESDGAPATYIADRTDGKVVALTAGGAAGSIRFDNTGFFSLQAQDPANIRDGSGGGLTNVLRAEADGRVAVGPSAPAASAKLDLQGTDGALLVPRLTTTERNALTPTDGMIIYNSSTGKFQGRAGGSWVDFH